MSFLQDKTREIERRRLTKSLTALDKKLRKDIFDLEESIIKQEREKADFNDSQGLSDIRRDLENI